MSNTKTYIIVRFMESGYHYILETGVSLKEAHAHCKNPNSSSATANEQALADGPSGRWFDGYQEE